MAMENSLNYSAFELHFFDEKDIPDMRFLLLTAAICMTAGAAAAELSYANVFAKRHNFDVDGAGDLDVNTYGGVIEYRYDNWTFSGELGRVDIEDLDLDFASVGAGYMMLNGVTLGLDHARFEVLNFDADVTSAYAMYTFGAYGLGLSAGGSSDLNDPVYSVFGAWDVTRDGRVGFDFVRLEEDNLLSAYADYNLDQYQVEADLITAEDFVLLAVSGAYDIGNGFSAIGSLSTFDAAGVDGNALTIGGQFSFAPGANVALALGRIDVDGAEDIDLVTFGLQYELGRKSSMRRTIANIFSDTTSSVAGLTDF